MAVISLNLDPATEAEKVNLAIRSTGFASSAFQVKDSTALPGLGITPNWDGQLPALALVGRGELLAFYQQAFSEHELLAILNPYFLE